MMPIPGSDAAVAGAASQGWTAVLVCGTFLFAMACLVWLIKKMFDEKGRLSDRLSMVEDFQRGQIMSLHTDTVKALTLNNTALEGLTQAIRNLPCPMLERDAKP